MPDDPSIRKRVGFLHWSSGLLFILIYMSPIRLSYCFSFADTSAGEGHGGLDMLWGCCCQGPHCYPNQEASVSVKMIARPRKMPPPNASCSCFNRKPYIKINGLAIMLVLNDEACTYDGGALKMEYFLQLDDQFYLPTNYQYQEVIINEVICWSDMNIFMRFPSTLWTFGVIMCILHLSSINSCARGVLLYAYVGKTSIPGLPFDL